jgi:hypothetical protein
MVKVVSQQDGPVGFVFFDCFPKARRIYGYQAAIEGETDHQVGCAEIALNEHVVLRVGFRFQPIFYRFEIRNYLCPVRGDTAPDILQILRQIHDSFYPEGFAGIGLLSGRELVIKEEKE